MSDGTPRETSPGSVNLLAKQAQIHSGSNGSSGPSSP